MTDDEYWEYIEWEKRQATPCFSRAVVRVRKLKAKLDCGHWVDGSDLYRYMVWKYPDDPEISQRTDCEVCARRDMSY